jgi:hypothetical protein
MQREMQADRFICTKHVRLALQCSCQHAMCIIIIIIIDMAEHGGAWRPRCSTVTIIPQAAASASSAAAPHLAQYTHP